MEHGQTNQMSRKSQCQNQAHGDTDYKEELERSLQVKDTKLKMEKHQKLTQFHGNIVDSDDDEDGSVTDFIPEDDKDDSSKDALSSPKKMVMTSSVIATEDGNNKNGEEKFHEESMKELSSKVKNPGMSWRKSISFSPPKLVSNVKYQ